MSKRKREEEDERPRKRIKTIISNRTKGPRTGLSEPSRLLEPSLHLVAGKDKVLIKAFDGPLTEVPLSDVSARFRREESGEALFSVGDQIVCVDWVHKDGWYDPSKLITTRGCFLSEWGDAPRFYPYFTVSGDTGWILGIDIGHEHHIMPGGICFNHVIFYAARIARDFQEFWHPHEEPAVRSSKTCVEYYTTEQEPTKDWHRAIRSALGPSKYVPVADVRARMEQLLVRAFAMIHAGVFPFDHERYAVRVMLQSHPLNTEIGYGNTCRPGSTLDSKRMRELFMPEITAVAKKSSDAQGTVIASQVHDVTIYPNGDTYWLESRSLRCATGLHLPFGTCPATLGLAVVFAQRIQSEAARLFASLPARVKQDLCSRAYTPPLK